MTHLNDLHEHKPVQHRDGKPPWCNTCGMTAGYLVPVSSFDQMKENRMSLNVQKYRVKPDDQEAVEVTKTNLTEIARWCGGAVMEGLGIEESDSGDYLYIPTMTGPVSARPGEIVAKDSNGRFNVFDKERFLSKYEPYSSLRGGW